MFSNILKSLKEIAWQAYVYSQVGKFLPVTQHRLHMLRYALQFVRDESVSGSYMEFGVAQGRTFVTAYHYAKRLNSPVDRFFAFDSFEGFPEPTGVDKEFERFKKGEEKWPLDIFLKNLRLSKIPSHKIQIVKGWFNESLTAELSKSLKKKSKISIAWIDCDLYNSTKIVLKFIKPLLQDGTVLVFDDWFCYRADPNKGEQRALREFLKHNPSITCIPYKQFGTVGMSFIVHKRK